MPANVLLQLLTMGLPAPKVKKIRVIWSYMGNLTKFQLIYQFFDIVRQIDLPSHRLAGPRMLEAKQARVERLTSQSAHGVLSLLG